MTKRLSKRPEKDHSLIFYNAMKERFIVRGHSFESRQEADEFIHRHKMTTQSVQTVRQGVYLLNVTENEEGSQE